VTIESRRGGQYSRPAEYTIENLQGRGDGVRWQTNAATRVERVVERRARRVSAPPSRIVEVDWRQQRQQDAGEFLHLLLDQFAVDTRSDGSAVLGRTLTKPQMAINRGVTDTLVKRLTTAARQKRTVEENAMLKEFADEQWDSTGNAARRTAIGKFFQGQTLQLKKCHHCGEYSPCTADPFLIEQLHLKPLAERPRGSLEELLEAASAPELPKDYRCHGCRKLGTTAIMTGLVRLPRVFVVRLDRAHRTSFGAESRISTPIDYPDHLNLAGTGTYL
jgi:ubiquitin C-terminal hydrolase